MDAQPLIDTGVSIPHVGVRNVLIVATEHDSLYAFDADTGQQYWHVSLLGKGETPSDPRNSDQVTPEIGITDTPVIDPAIGGGTIFCVAMSKDASGNYFQRLHAIDIRTHKEEYGDDRTIAASFPGSGENATNGQIVFDPKQYKERAALLLSNGQVYLTWASHSDIEPYNSWVMSYSVRNLKQTTALCLTPNGTEGAFWGSGNGPAADSAGNVYLLSGNGTFDEHLTSAGFPNENDYGNAFIKLSTTSGLKVTDYFTPSNTDALSKADPDLASSSPVLLPALKDAADKTVHLEIAAGKGATIYLVNTDDMGKFNAAGDTNVYQEINGALAAGEYASPVYFNHNIYYGARGDSIKEFHLSDAKLLTTPLSQSSNTFAYPGTSPAISANGTKDAILWAVENGTTAILHAYDANDLSDELWNSTQASNGRDTVGTGNKFISPVVANGKVYVGTTNSVSVFGLLS